MRRTAVRPQYGDVLHHHRVNIRPEHLKNGADGGVLRGLGQKQMKRLVGLRHLRFPLGALHLKRELAQMVDRLLPGSLGGQTRDLCLQDPAQLKKIRPADGSALKGKLCIP